MNANRLPASTWLLTLAQALNLTTAVIMVTVGAVAGSELAPEKGWATIPYGAQFAAVMLLTYPVSMLMARYGRKPIFVTGCGVLVAAGYTGWAATTHASFTLLILSHVLVGAYIASANFYRFAAIDQIDSSARPKAISMVVAGGVLAAILGPWIAASLRDIPGLPSFSAIYGALGLIGLFNLLILLGWNAPAERSIARQDAPRKRLWEDGGANTPVVLAIAVASGGYLLMNLVMVQSSLVLKDFCSFTDTSRAIQAHVIAMFAPSFVTGRLIARWGLRSILTLGIAFIAMASIIGATPVRYEAMVAALIFLGLGWNFTYVGGGALLSQSVGETHKHRWQGINDTVIAACATAGAFLPAPMLAVLDWRGSNLAVLVLSGASGIVVWLTLAKRDHQAATLASRTGGA